MKIFVAWSGFAFHQGYLTALHLCDVLITSPFMGLQRPTALKGHTTFIANDKGHLLPGAAKVQSHQGN